MDVTSTGTSAGTNTAAAAKAATSVAAKMNADTFLKLLMAQLQNQDPTKPMDSTEYVGQLATFSQVEQATKTNQKLDSLLTSSFLNQADAIIGRTLTSADGLTTGTVQSVRVTGDGVMAKLADGREMLLASGISIS
ncbi:flagellar basal-body rod modification protein FlgD [Methylorubrum rhodesianum]|jgi:flagellar basal-body rod modification protein FlgD|uniref:Basal-body rod modification protein FlgD n=1 Tax=Methylorubrum rhodesianum TaxID=29427 RepID=A0ABU9Z671_9HYPH|nr:MULTISPECIES: flagellar hook assembly protein FlgD [Methylorubrum]MBB5764837.1 flagellar basal-body rod modification protein FlgD [Methylorubrum rhodesianum]MBI1691344.1 flagellar hook assembly protein FlgD [Methylorubrum sp. DB1722]MBK3401667.1 flagellar hook assembly protein FlgD [Methylorubrum rhodesianum]MBY0142231.1 flagellar hook assembly protein FlgD [Methylorubrum populi]